MKKFFIKIVVFVLILLILSSIFDFVITSGIKKTGGNKENDNEEFTTWNAIITSSINAEVIINGTSRAFSHINPFILDTLLNTNSYNIGMAGASFEKQYVRYLTFEKYNSKPKYIIQNVDYNTLSVSNSIDDRFLPYLPFIEGKKYLYGVTKFNSFFPFYRYCNRSEYFIRGLQEFFHIKHFPDLRVKGFFAFDKKWEISKFNQVLIGDSLVALKQTEAIKLFDLYINNCKKNNIQIIFVFTPLYSQATEFYKNLQEVIDIYNCFSKKYNIPFLDYSKDPICCDTNYFYNAKHLNKKGAELFSIKLAYDLDSLGLFKNNHLHNPDKGNY